MKFVTVFMMVVMLFGAAGYAQGDPGGAPQIVFSNDSHVFHQVLEGDDVIHDFFFRNEGQAPLSVTKVRTG